MTNEIPPDKVMRNVNLDASTDAAIRAIADEMPVPNYSAAVRQIVAEWKKLKKLAATVERMTQ